MTNPFTSSQRQLQYNPQRQQHSNIFLFVFTIFKQILMTVEHFKRVVYDLFVAKKPFWPSLFQVDVESSRHGGELVASVLKIHGVNEVFTLCGGHISPILVACKAIGINVYDTRHEATAVYAADAVARLRQSIGVAAVTAGPGVTNAVTALKNAQMAESPVLLLAGASPSLAKGRGALQDIDQISLMSPICKYTARVTLVRNIVPTIAEAIACAHSGTPGPVFVELPIDVLYPFHLVAREAGISTTNSFRFDFKSITQLYLNWYIHRVFAGAWTEDKIPDLTPRPVTIPLPTKTHIDGIVSLLQKAQRPLILVGSQATLAPINPMELAQSLESLGVPTFLGGMARGLMGSKSSLNIRHNRRDALRQADCIILAGSICDFRLQYGKSLPKSANIIAINRDISQLKKNHGVFWNATELVQADVGTTLVEVAKRFCSKNAQDDHVASRSEKWASWLETLHQTDQDREASIIKKASQCFLPAGPTTSSGNQQKQPLLNPLMVLNALEHVLPDDAILVADGGDFVGSAAYILRPRGPLQWLDPGPFGTLGVGAGFALGAKVVRPDAPVIIIYGDGACGFSLMEFDTFVRHRLSVIAVIGNDACWTQIARDQVPFFGSDIGCQLEFTRYDLVGEGLGTIARQLPSSLTTSPDTFLDLEKEFRAVIDKSRSKKDSAVLNILIGRSDFREGSISV